MQRSYEGLCKTARAAVDDPPVLTRGVSMLPAARIAALAVANACGVKLGNPAGAESLRRAGKGGMAMRAAVSANAAVLAADFAPVFAAIQAAGHSSLQAISSELTAWGIRTRRGGQWQVSNVLKFLGRVSAKCQ